MCTYPRIIPEDPLVYEGKGNYQDGSYHQLIIRILDKPHPHFKRGVGIKDICHPNPLNLFYETKADVISVLLKQPIKIPSLDKDIYILPDIKDFSRNIIVVPEKGMINQLGEKGDLFVIVRLTNPELSQNQITSLKNSFPDLVLDIPEKLLVPSISCDNYRRRFGSRQQQQQQQCTHQ